MTLVGLNPGHATGGLSNAGDAHPFKTQRAQFTRRTNEGLSQIHRTDVTVRRHPGAPEQTGRVHDRATRINLIRGQPVHMRGAKANVGIRQTQQFFAPRRACHQ